MASSKTVDLDAFVAGVSKTVGRRTGWTITSYWSVVVGGLMAGRQREAVETEWIEFDDGDDDGIWSRYKSITTALFCSTLTDNMSVTHSQRQKLFQVILLYIGTCVSSQSLLDKLDAVLCDMACWGVKPSQTDWKWILWVLDKADMLGTNRMDDIVLHRHLKRWRSIFNSHWCDPVYLEPHSHMCDTASRVQTAGSIFIPLYRSLYSLLRSQKSVENETRLIRLVELQPDLHPEEYEFLINAHADRGNIAECFQLSSVFVRAPFSEEVAIASPYACLTPSIVQSMLKSIAIGIAKSGRRPEALCRFSVAPHLTPTENVDEIVKWLLRSVTVDQQTLEMYERAFKVAEKMNGSQLAMHLWRRFNEWKRKNECHDFSAIYWSICVATMRQSGLQREAYDAFTRYLACATRQSDRWDAAIHERFLRLALQYKRHWVAEKHLRRIVFMNISISSDLTADLVAFVRLDGLKEKIQQK